MVESLVFNKIDFMEPVKKYSTFWVRNAWQMASNITEHKRFRTSAATHGNV